MSDEVYTYSDGSTYKGEWKDGKRHGKGTWVRPDGMRYEGEWINNKPHGQGTLTNPDGKSRSGLWEDGKFISSKQEAAESQKQHSSEPVRKELPQASQPIQQTVKPKKPIWKHWWAWAIAAVLLFLFIGIIGGGNGEQQDIAADPAETGNEMDTIDNDDTEEIEETESEAEEYIHTFYHFGVEPEEFRNRWNSVIFDTGLGYRIDDLSANTRDLYGFGGDWAVLAVDDWLALEILIHDDGYVGDVYMDAVPATDAQGTDLVAMITALIAAVTGYDTETSFDIAQYDLKLANIEENLHLELYEGDNADIRIYGDRNGWNVSVEPHRR
jgi:hypothetical protein